MDLSLKAFKRCLKAEHVSTDKSDMTKNRIKQRKTSIHHWIFPFLYEQIFYHKKSGNPKTTDWLFIFVHLDEGNEIFLHYIC